MRLVGPLTIISNSAGQRGLVWFLWLVVILQKAPESQDCEAPRFHWAGLMGAGEKEWKKKGQWTKGENKRESSKLKQTYQRQALEWSPWAAWGQMRMEKDRTWGDAEPESGAGQLFCPLEGQAWSVEAAETKDHRLGGLSATEISRHSGGQEVQGMERFWWETFSGLRTKCLHLKALIPPLRAPPPRYVLHGTTWPGCKSWN